MSAVRAGAGGPVADPLRVGLLTPCFWPEVRRGGERFVNDLARGLLARGHAPRLITSRPGPTRSTVEDGLAILRLWRPPDGRLRRRNFEHYITHVPLSYVALARGGYDVAHAVHPTDGLAAARWARRTGRPAVLSYLGVPNRAALVSHRLRLEITQRAVEGATAVTALSRAAADAFRRWLGVEVRVIHPGVDLDTFRPGGQRAEAPTIFCSAAVDEPRKRVGLLVEALRLVRREEPSVRLVLSRPRSSAGRASLPEGVTLVDVDDEDALVREYRRAWVTALPSHGEAFGLVLVESLACGTPVVGTSDGAIPEVVDRPEVGRLFARDDPASLAAELLDALRLTGDPGTAEACRARAADFSAERCTAAYEQLYRELLGG
jgi:phosphatidylinositol alpha-mannosyltransferase